MCAPIALVLGVAPAPTKAPFWRAFGAAVVLYMVPVSISVVVVASGYGLVGQLIVIAVAFGLLALVLPRAAAILLVALSVVGIVGDIWICFDHHVWYVLLVPLHVAAIVYGVSAFKLRERLPV